MRNTPLNFKEFFPKNLGRAGAPTGGEEGGFSFLSKAVAREKKANPRVAIFNPVVARPPAATELQRGAKISPQLAGSPQRNLGRN